LFGNAKRGDLPGHFEEPDSKLIMARAVPSECVHHNVDVEEIHFSSIKSKSAAVSSKSTPGAKPPSPETGGSKANDAPDLALSPKAATKASLTTSPRDFPLSCEIRFPSCKARSWILIVVRIFSFSDYGSGIMMSMKDAMMLFPQIPF
jgi:hypothetical protein